MLRYGFGVMAVLSVVTSLVLFTSAPVLAADLRSGDTVTVVSGEVVDDDLYVAGSTIVIEGNTSGDLWAFGREITVIGEVGGGIVAVGDTVNVKGNVAHAVRLAGGTININSDIEGDLLIGGGDVTIASTARVGGDLLIGAGTVRIDGLVEGDIKGGGGAVIIAGGVDGDVELSVDELTIASTADIQGNLTYTSGNKADIQSGARVGGTTSYEQVEPKESAKESPFAGIGGKVIAFLMTLVAGVIIILVAPKRLKTIADSIRSKPWASLGWGAVILFATPIAALVVCITVIGIPVGLITLVLYGITIYLSQIFVGLFIGRWIIGYFREVDSKAILIGALASGLVILTLLKLIPYLGFWIGLAAVLFALGALVVAEVKSRAEAKQIT